MENRMIRWWVNRPLRDFHVALGVAAVILHVLGRLSQITNLLAIADILCLFVILHYFIHGYFHRQQQFLSNNQRVYSQPKKKIVRIGAFFLAIFMVAVGVGMTLVKELYSGTLYAKLKAMVLYILAKVFGAAVDTGGLGRDELLFRDTDLLGTMNQVAQKEASPWENIVNSIQTILIVVGVIFLIVLIVMMIVNSLKRLVTHVNVETRQKVSLNVNDREESLRRETGKRENIFDFSPNAKLRRLYRRQVNRQRKRGQMIPDYMTPKEIEAMVKMTCDEKHQELHSLYEKARYSENGCTPEDAQKAKELKL